METLLAHEVDIDQEDPQHGTPLYMACTYQRTECVKKLLELGTPGKGARGELVVVRGNAAGLSVLPLYLKHHGLFPQGLFGSLILSDSFEAIKNFPCVDKEIMIS